MGSARAACHASETIASFNSMMSVMRRTGAYNVTGPGRRSPAPWHEPVRPRSLASRFMVLSICAPKGLAAANPGPPTILPSLGFPNAWLRVTISVVVERLFLAGVSDAAVRRWTLSVSAAATGSGHAVSPRSSRSARPVACTSQPGAVVALRHLPFVSPYPRSVAAPAWEQRVLQVLEYREVPCLQAFTSRRAPAGAGYP